MEELDWAKVIVSSGTNLSSTIAFHEEEERMEFSYPKIDTDITIQRKNREDTYSLDGNIRTNWRDGNISWVTELSTQKWLVSSNNLTYSLPGFLTGTVSTRMVSVPSPWAVMQEVPVKFIDLQEVIDSMGQSKE